MLNGTEADRRHEFEELVGNFPKINLQKQLCRISEINRERRENGFIQEDDVYINKKLRHGYTIHDPC